MSEDKDYDVDALLDGTLDDLEDMPENKPFPPGAHRVTLSMSLKEINKKKCVEIALKAVETMELADPDNYEPLVEGDETNVLCFLTSKFGQGTFKMLGEVLAPALGTTSNRETIEAAQDIECIVLTTSDKEGKYTNIKELQVVQRLVF